MTEVLKQETVRVMAVHARPCLNGNSPRDFLHAAHRLREAATGVEEALGNVRANVFHGRNYQTYAQAMVEPQRKLDSLLMEHAVQCARDLIRLSDAIAIASGET
jgi:hypothetical protein